MGAYNEGEETGIKSVNEKIDSDREGTALLLSISIYELNLTIQFQVQCGIMAFDNTF